MKHFAKDMQIIRSNKERIRDNKFIGVGAAASDARVIKNKLLELAKREKKKRSVYTSEKIICLKVIVCSASNMVCSTAIVFELKW